jgi:hypothetical protein
MELVISYHKKIQCISITKISWFILFRKVIIICSENHMKTINRLRGEDAQLLNVTAGGPSVLPLGFKELKAQADTVEVTYWLIYSWRTTGVSKTFKDCL